MSASPSSDPGTVRAWPAPATEAAASARSLPIWERADEIADLIEQHQVVVVAGETGSGKSTQLPRICLDIGRGTDGRIGHTQPRRIAARSVAARLADEAGEDVGETIGYAVRFDDRVAASTRVKVMTDGILLAEIQRDPDLTAYDTLIVDEAHERSLNIDFLLGWLHGLLPRRPDLRLIVTSATIDTERFADHFGGAPIVEVSGRTYPVTVEYHPPDDRSLPEAITDAVSDLWRRTDGDMLVFCAGERDIREAARAIEADGPPGLDVFPLYARLSAAEQQRVFRPHRGRRVVLATNVAETSLTVPGIRCVVDPGLARISRYSARTKVQRLPIEKVSQASADQRAGRCGRVAPGVCIRLYEEDDYDARPEFTEPEITRTNLAAVILQMASLGLGDIEGFPFVEPPDARSIADGINALDELGAVDPERRETGRWLTPLGRRLARLPVDPRLGRMLLAAEAEGCVEEVATVAAALSVPDVRERPHDQREKADTLHRRFEDPRSDFVSILRLWGYLDEQRRDLSGNRFRRLCRDEFLHHLRFREWADVRRQLLRAAGSVGIDRSSLGRVDGAEGDPSAAGLAPGDADALHRALLTGLITNVGRRTDQTEGRWTIYEGPRSMRFVLAGASAPVKRAPRWAMAAELVETDRLRARTVAPVDPGWFESLAEHLLRWTYDGAEWDPRTGRALVTERASLLGLPVIPGRRIALRRVDPELARELFVHHALVDPDWSGESTKAVERFLDLPVIAEHRALRDEAANLVARSRDRDLAADLGTVRRFYEAALPDGVDSVESFLAWRRRLDGPDPLAMTLDDLVPDRHALELDRFPDHLDVGGRRFALDYEFDPSSPVDGVIVDVPVDALADLPTAPFTWTVPGYRPALVAGLLRSLPKAQRRDLIPLADTAEEIVAVLGAPADDDRTLSDVVADHLRVRRGLSVAAFDDGAVDGHLRPTFRILGDDGVLLAAGKDLDRLRERLDRRAEAALAAERHPIERDGADEWPDLPEDELPRTVDRVVGGHRVTAFPALVDERRHDAGDLVAVRVFTDAAQRDAEMWAGTRRLLELGLTVRRRVLVDRLGNDDRLAMAASPWGSVDDWLDEVVEIALDAVIASAGGPAWTGARFRALDRWTEQRLPETLTAALDGALAARRIGAEVRRGVATTEWPAAAADSVVDVVDRLARFDAPGALRRVGLAGVIGEDLVDDRPLSPITRHLDGLVHRVDALRRDPARERRALAEVLAFEAEIGAAGAAPGPGSVATTVERLLDELRLARLAQPVGTAVPVSEKRIRRRVAAGG